MTSGLESKLFINLDLKSYWLNYNNGFCQQHLHNNHYNYRVLVSPITQHINLAINFHVFLILKGLIDCTVIFTGARRFCQYLLLILAAAAYSSPGILVFTNTTGW